MIMQQQQQQLALDPELLHWLKCFVQELQQQLQGLHNNSSSSSKYKQQIKMAPYTEPYCV